MHSIGWYCIEEIISQETPKFALLQLHFVDLLNIDYCKCKKLTKINHWGLISVLLRGGSRTAAASKMELFVIIVNSWKPLTIITKRSVLDIAAVLDPPLLLLILIFFRIEKKYFLPHLLRKCSWKNKTKKSIVIRNGKRVCFEYYLQLNLSSWRY